MISASRTSIARLILRKNGKLLGVAPTRCGASTITVRSLQHATSRLSPPPQQSSLPFSTAVVQEEEGDVPIDVRSQLPPEYTPGHVMAVLNQVGKGGAEISEENFRLLLECARPYEEKDAGVIMTAMVNYKRISRFLLTKELASDCIAQIIASDVRQGGLHVLENFTPASGLYYAAPTDALHKALAHVLEELDDYNNESRVWLALIAFINNLVQRRQRPYRTYKKRAARRYIKQIQTHEGPNAETVALCVELGLAVTDEDATSVYQAIVEPCLEARVANIDEEMLESLKRKMVFETTTTDDTLDGDNNDDNTPRVWTGCDKEGVLIPSVVIYLHVFAIRAIHVFAVVGLVRHDWCS